MAQKSSGGTHREFGYRQAAGWRASDAGEGASVCHTIHKEEKRQCFDCDNNTEKPNDHEQPPLANPCEERAGVTYNVLIRMFCKANDVPSIRRTASRKTTPGRYLRIG